MSKIQSSSNLQKRLKTLKVLSKKRRDPFDFVCITEGMVVSVKDRIVNGKETFPGGLSQAKTKFEFKPQLLFPSFFTSLF